MSHTTVHRAINNLGRVNPETLEKVLSAAKRLGYRPSMVGQMLAKRKTNVIGAIVGGLGDSTHGSIVQFLEHIASQNGYSVIIRNTFMDPEARHNAVEMMIRHRVEGVMIIPLDKEVAWDASDFRKLKKAGIPTVLIAEKSPEDLCDTVYPDFKAAAESLVKHLLQQGYRKIGYLYGSTEAQWDYSEQGRFMGYCSALREAGIEPNEAYMLKCATPALEESKTFDSQAVINMFSQQDRPEAVLCFCDMLAIKTMSTLQRMGLKIPDDIALVGIDNILASAAIYPALTTFAQPVRKIGEEAFKLLLERIGGTADENKKHIRIDGELLVRESSVKKHS